MSRFKKLNTPRKILDRIFSYPVKQRMLTRFPRPTTNFAREYFRGKPITGCEIGSFKGEHSKSMLKFLNIKKIYLIDPYAKYEDWKNSEDFYNEIMQAEIIVKKKLKKYEEKVVFIKKFSNKAVEDISLCDFIYIDGNHRYKYIKEDLKLYSKKIKEGGIIGGHDTQILGVIKAVVEFAAKNPDYTLHIESPDWWLVKNERLR